LNFYVINPTSTIDLSSARDRESIVEFGLGKMGVTVRNVCAVLLIGFCVSLGFGEGITNPELVPMTFGSETPGWRWNSPKKAEGEYDGETFTLTGNGHGIYQCWDGFAGAFTAEQPAGDFTFTARIASAPDKSLVPTATKVGIFAKAKPDAISPVIAFHWDYFWENKNGNGLGWFNRFTPSSQINFNDEKGCVDGLQGCRGMGYEGTVEGFEEREGLWLRIRRQKDGNLQKYHLYARYDSDTGFHKVESISGPNNPCNSSEPLSPVNLPAFLLPEAPVDGTIFFGVYVAGADHGSNYITASFDNISLVTEESAALGKHPKAKAGRALRVSYGHGHVRIRGLAPDEIRQVSLISSRGSRITTCRQFYGEVNTAFALDPRLAPGAYLLHTDLINGDTRVLPIVVK